MDLSFGLTAKTKYKMSNALFVCDLHNKIFSLNINAYFQVLLIFLSHCIFPLDYFLFCNWCTTYKSYIVYEILQVRILEWVVFTFSRGLPNTGMEPRSPALQTDSLPAEPQGKPNENKDSYKDYITFGKYLGSCLLGTIETSGIYFF